MLLVHGFSASARLWMRSGWTKALERGGRNWIAPDLRGHGQSERFPTPAAYHTTELVSDLVRVLDAAEVAQADLVGYSLGGELALEFAVAHPERARRLVVGGIGRRRPLDPADTMTLYEAVVRGSTTGVDTAARRMWATASCGADADPVVLAAFLAGIGASGQVQGAEVLGHPVLLFAGTEDPVASGAEELAARLSGAELIRLPGHDHTTAVSDPTAINAGIAWLTR